VKIEDGPAAVTGDESCITSLSTSENKRQLMGRRMKRVIRKSEDLPEMPVWFCSACCIVTVVDYR